MTDDAGAAPAPEEPKKKKSRLLLPVAVLLLGGAGFGTTYMGLWSPAALLPSAQAAAKHTEPKVEFVDVPTVEVPVPGPQRRSVVLSASIETDAADTEQVLHLMPRVSDAFTTFLSEVDPAAYEKRGVLEIIRGELITRTRFVLGEGPVKDLLITEFRIK
ncbi:flagellar basal body-associated FliL family protein [Paracoccus sp. (in: a-proteobacteria)]|uniref:flagellar basal body-associated FliL family protein n=1 Tax=Paracoccus sp. TaxID=267 RepID=UPI003A8BDBBB